MTQGCEGNPPAVYCEGKKRIPCKTLADQIAKRCNRTGRHQKAHPYKCRACGDWHIGSSSASKSARRSLREATQS